MVSSLLQEDVRKETKAKYFWYSSCMLYNIYSFIDKLLCLNVIAGYFKLY